MGLPIPNLDDKKYTELVQEAINLIPRFAEQWTDHNVHDPGITFTELFAWLAEMQIYQLNRVSNQHIYQFLKMVGLAPRSLNPAHIEVPFKLKPGTEVKFIPAGTQLLPIGKEHIVFKVTEDFFLSSTQLGSVLTQYAHRTIDQTEANAKADVYYAPFGQQSSQKASLLLGFDGRFPGVDRAHLTFQLFEADLPVLPETGILSTDVTPSVQLLWEYRYDEKWQACKIIKDETRNLTQSGNLVFVPPRPWDQKDGLFWLRARMEQGQYEIIPLIRKIQLNTLAAIQVDTIINEDLGNGLGIPGYQVRLSHFPIYITESADFSALYAGDILDWPGFLAQLRSQANSKIPNPTWQFWRRLDAEIQKLVSEDLANRLPDESEKGLIVASLNQVLGALELYDAVVFSGFNFPEAYLKLIARLDKNISEPDLLKLNRLLFEFTFPSQVTRSSFTIQVQSESGIWEDWHRVEDFKNSTPTDPHYLLDAEQGIVTFGNGLNGKIPQTSQRIRAFFYQFSLGASGNLPPGQTWRINKSDCEGVRGLNSLAAKDGLDAETLEEAQLRAQKDFNTQYRAVTSVDYEQLALATPGLRIARAKALPNYHPDFRCFSFPGSVTVVVVPYSRAGTETPAPGPGLLATVLRHLEPKRMVTTELHVIGPDYVKISVQAKIFLKRKSSPDLVKTRVMDALAGFLHPTRGGPEKQGWIFGRSVFPSEIYQLIDKVEGVDHVTQVSLSAEGPHRITKRCIEIPANGLVYAGVHQLEFLTGNSY